MTRGDLRAITDAVTKPTAKSKATGGLMFANFNLMMDK